MHWTKGDVCLWTSKHVGRKPLSQPASQPLSDHNTDKEVHILGLPSHTHHTPKVRPSLGEASPIDCEEEEVKDIADPKRINPHTQPSKRASHPIPLSGPPRSKRLPPSLDSTAIIPASPLASSSSSFQGWKPSPLPPIQECVDRPFLRESLPLPLSLDLDAVWGANKPKD